MLKRLFRRRTARLRVAYDEAYRLPIPSLEGARGGFEVRRADDALHYLLRVRAVRTRDVVNPVPVTYEALARVHTPEYLDALQEPATLASIYAVPPHDIVGEGALRSVRLAVGGTVWATRETLRTGSPSLNLSGGFHHAFRGKGSGFCALNDVAVASALVRHDGFSGRIGVLDLDFHPPDGTADCLAADPSVWVGSISGTSWGPLPGVDDVVLPPKAGNDAYLEALRALLARAPSCGLWFVLSGGDVLAGDPLGDLGLTLGGIRERDLLVARHLRGRPQVWLPAGGYTPHAWKALAGTGMAIALDSDEVIPLDYDPLAARMVRISRSLGAERLSGSDALFAPGELDDLLGHPSPQSRRFLDFYTAQGLELALERYRVLPLLRRLGYEHLHVVLSQQGPYDVAKLHAVDSVTAQPVVLIELEVQRRELAGRPVLFVNWLSLRNPRARFSALRPKLPGQDVPGLGLAREMTNLLRLIAKRLGLAGVAFHPSWFHMAYAARHGSQFVDPARQGRFLALVRDLEALSLTEATRAVAEGRVLLNGQPYAWEAEDMVHWLEPPMDEQAQAALTRARDAAHFTVRPSVQQAAG